MTFNSTTTWGWPAKALHWIGAAIILLLLGHGWWMTHMTPRPDRLANYAWHSALGYDLLILIVLRLLWRWFNPVPEPPAGLNLGSGWRRVLGRIGDEQNRRNDARRNPVSIFRLTDRASHPPSCL